MDGIILAQVDGTILGQVVAGEALISLSLQISGHTCSICVFCKITNAVGR